MCHFYQSSKPVADRRKYRNWGDYIKKNSDRIKQ